MPALLEPPLETDLGPFADLIGGEGNAPAYQLAGGRFSEVPKAEIATPTDYGAFTDLLPPGSVSAHVGAPSNSASNGDELGVFSDLVPASSTAESEKALAETEAFRTDPLIQAEKGVAKIAPMLGGLHETMNAVRVFGSAAGRYMFRGLEGLSRAQAKLLDNPTLEMRQPPGEDVLLSPAEQEKLEAEYVKEAQAGVPDALARTEYFKSRAEGADRQSYVDPALADTIPVRLAAAGGEATFMAMESLIPGAGLPLMVMHGALATESEALASGQTPEQAEAAGIRSAIGLGIFGGVSKIAAVTMAHVLPKFVHDPGKLTKFIAQFSGQETANESSSRAIAAWNAAEMAEPGKKTEAAIAALKETTLEGTVMNAAFALHGAAKMTGVQRVQPGGATSRNSTGDTTGAIEGARSPDAELRPVPVERAVRPASEPIPAAATMERPMPETPQAAEPALRAEAGNVDVSRQRASQSRVTIHEETGLPLNDDGTVTLYHGTTTEGAKAIQQSKYLKSKGEPDVYLTTEPSGTGYGDGTVVRVRIDPAKLNLDDAFPNGRKDFRVTIGKSKILPIKLETGAANAKREIPREPEFLAKIPEHLRPDPEVQRLLSEPGAQTGPQMKLEPALEGGALFSRGGKRAILAPKGTTPKGDTEFLRIESGLRRLPKGLERKGAADVLGDTRNKVGQLLSKATRRHVDTEQEIYGQLYAKFDQAASGPRKRVEAAFNELEPYLAAKENGRPKPILSPEAQKILTAWEDVAESTGNLARANGVQVFDPTTGTHRPMGNLGRAYVPRMMKPEVERVMQDPKQNPVLWNDLVDAFAKHRGISDADAAKELRAEAGRFSSNDFMGNLERARTGQLPEIFYDYDLRRVASRYIPAFSERMAQIIAYGQRLGPRESPQRPNLWDIARSESENDYTQRWLNSAEDQSVNLRAKTASGVGIARAQTLASGLLLSSPTTSVVRNTLSGLASTVELMGVKRSLKPMVAAISKAERTNAREMGVVRRDMGDFLHADKLGKTVVDDAVRAVTDTALKYSGYTGSEVFVRTHAALAGSQFARDGVAAIGAKPTSMRAKEALALFKRMGVDAGKIMAEGADWKSGPETRKFIRTMIRDTQGGYRFDQVPLWANSNMGRFFYQFGRWGTQRARNIWKNGIKPALGEEVQWQGKTMTRRDVRPLLKMAAGSVLLGEAFAQVAAGLFGRDRRDASLEEITQAWQQDEKVAVALAFERVLNDIIMSGTMGIWSQPVDFAKSLKDQTRLKNPTEPPGLASIIALKDLGLAFIDQGGEVTNNDLLKFAGTVVPGPKQISDVGRNVMDEPLYEAQNDVKTLRAAAQRWAKREGLDVAPKAKGSFRKSELAPVYEPIKEALLVGDAQRARVLASDFLNGQPNRAKATQSLKASVKASQPFRVGPYTAASHRIAFQKWARTNLNEADYEQTERIQARYVKSAAKAGLW